MPKEPTVFYTKPKKFLLIGICFLPIVVILCYANSPRSIEFILLLGFFLYIGFQKPRPIFILQEDGLYWYPSAYTNINPCCIYIPWQAVCSVGDYAPKDKWFHNTKMTIPLKIVSAQQLLNSHPDKRARKRLKRMLGREDTLWLDVRDFASADKITPLINEYLENYRQQHPQ
jgi:hypothetical protein